MHNFITRLPKWMLHTYDICLGAYEHPKIAHVSALFVRFPEERPCVCRARRVCCPHRPTGAQGIGGRKHHETQVSLHSGHFSPCLALLLSQCYSALLGVMLQAKCYALGANPTGRSPQTQPSSGGSFRRTEPCGEQVRQQLLHLV